MEKIKKVKKDRKWILFSVLMILVLAAGSFYWTQVSGGLIVDTQTIERGPVVKLIKETGTVESDSSSVITAKSMMEIKRFDFKEGDVVRAGQVILETDVTAAQLAVKSMESEAAALRIQYNRTKELSAQSKLLFEQGAISEDDYLMTVTAERQLAAQVSAINYSVASMRENVDAGGITSPIDGVITEVFVKVGETVLPGSPVLEISDLNTLYVSTNLVAADADQIKVGNMVLVYNEDTGFRDENAKVRKIHLKAIDLVSDLGINQKRVIVEIALSDMSNVRLGNDLDVEVTVDTRENVLTASKKAIFELDSKDYAYVVKEGKAELREVEIGLKGEDSWEILAGLEEGEIIIVSPGNDVDEGAKIKL